MDSTDSEPDADLSDPEALPSKNRVSERLSAAMRVEGEELRQRYLRYEEERLRQLDRKAHRLRLLDIAENRLRRLEREAEKLKRLELEVLDGLDGLGGEKLASLERDINEARHLVAARKLDLEVIDESLRRLDREIIRVRFLEREARRLRRLDVEKNLPRPSVPDDSLDPGDGASEPGDSTPDATGDASDGGDDDDNVPSVVVTTETEEDSDSALRACISAYGKPKLPTKSKIHACAESWLSGPSGLFLPSSRLRICFFGWYLGHNSVSPDAKIMTAWLASSVIEVIGIILVIARSLFPGSKVSRKIDLGKTTRKKNASSKSRAEKER